jgi:spore coat protein A, manganese oxidase
MQPTYITKRLLIAVSMLTINSTPSYPQTLLHPRTQPQFVNQLPVPPVINALDGGTFTVSISQFNQWLGLVDAASQEHLLTKVWGYNGHYPGPTILAKKNVAADFFWRNNLVDENTNPLPHLLRIDTTIHTAFDGNPTWRQNGIPIVTHLHGGHTESASDGLPDAWYTPGYTLKGHEFIKGDVLPYHYSNTQEAATIWYHDHALGITRLNVYAGLAGYYLITDNNEINLQATNALPAAPYDLGLAIQDRMFTSNGQLYYPTLPEMPTQPEPSALPEFFGNFILVNGMAWPVLDVEPRQYRFRVLNGSDSRFYNLFLSSGLLIQQIGSDDGLLRSPVAVTQMLIAPGERKDIIIDFSDPALAGQTIILRNNGKTPFPKGAAPDPQTTGRIMAFRVTKALNTTYPLTSLPSTLREVIVPLATTLPARKLILFEAEDEYDRLKPMIGTADDGVLNWHDPITENPALNTTEIWEIYNETVDAHPVHLHMVKMQLVNRQRFHAQKDEETGKIISLKMTGQPQLPPPEEQGWKDTWVAYPGEVTRVIATFDIEGLYVWHCHILSHEDHEMMRPYYVGNMNMLAKKNIITEDFSAEKVQPQMQPNPFTNNFTVRFTLPHASSVFINLYDAKGSLIKKITSSNLAAGAQKIVVNGDKMANGVYYCEVVINGERIVRKMILEK